MAGALLGRLAGTSSGSLAAEARALETGLWREPQVSRRIVDFLLGGVLPLMLLAVKSLRQRPDALFVASLLAVLGVAFNRMNVVIFAMDFRGRMPWVAAESYVPSIVEWGVSIGLIAATIFLFGLAARHMPVLSRAEPVEGH